MENPNLSPEINRILSATKNAKTVDIKSEERGALFDITSGNTNFTIVVTDPENNEIALVSNNPDIPINQLWLVLGAGWGGSMMSIGRIIVGAQMRMRCLTGGVIETSPVKTICRLSDHDKAEEIMKLAETNRPRFMTEAERQEYRNKFIAKVEEIISKEFPLESQDWIREAISYFENLSAKGVVLGALLQALRHNKLDLAHTLLGKYCREYWYFQPPNIAGDPDLMPLNARRWNEFYEELGVPLPSQE